MSDQKKIRYETLARMSLRRPVDRLDYIAAACVGKSVVDVGCYDETALQKRETKHWLHGRIAAVAKRVVGIDSSAGIPQEGIRTAGNAVIRHGDGVEIDMTLIGDGKIDLIVAGEFIEHIENPQAFFRNLRERFPGAEFILSTPNGSSFANTLLGLLNREVQHPDHVQVFSYKVLHTLCARAGFQSWEVIPYRFFATEMILSSPYPRRLFVQLVERCIRGVEFLFPLLSFGYVVRAKL